VKTSEQIESIQRNYDIAVAVLMRSVRNMPPWLAAARTTR
jgi:hypothetical protein